MEVHVAIDQILEQRTGKDDCSCFLITIIEQIDIFKILNIKCDH